MFSSFSCTTHVTQCNVTEAEMRWASEYLMGAWGVVQCKNIFELSAFPMTFIFIMLFFMKRNQKGWRRERERTEQPNTVIHRGNVHALTLSCNIKNMKISAFVIFIHVIILSCFSSDFYDFSSTSSLLILALKSSTHVCAIVQRITNIMMLPYKQRLSIHVYAFLTVQKEWTLNMKIIRIHSERKLKRM